MKTNHDIARQTEKPDVIMGSISNAWREGEAKSITLSITQDCNLRCTYCYMIKKNNKHRMTFETAKSVVDYVLENRELFNTPAVIWEFIGGEPLIEIGLVNEISEYIKLRMYELDHPWQNNYVFFMCTNGLLYDTPAVQEYIVRNRAHISIGISIDGNKIKHDLSRKKPDGTGSYDDVIKNVPLWLKQFPGSMTKATFAHDDLPYLKDSIISLWNHGIKTVAANVVFEDVWSESDPILFEDQLKQLADYIIVNELWDKYSVRFFDPSNGFPLTKDSSSRPYCGAGRMLAVDDMGIFYPCVRFLEFCQNNGKIRSIGNVVDGIDLDRIRPFYGLSIKAQSSDMCLTCEVASGCANCIGNDFDNSDSGTIFHRATYICQMHKAAVRAGKYLWKRYSDVTHKLSPRDIHAKSLLTDKQWVRDSAKFMYFILYENIEPHCLYTPTGNTEMNTDIFNKEIAYCLSNNYIPVFLGSTNYARSYAENHIAFFIDQPTDFTDNYMDILTHESIGSQPSKAHIAIYNARIAGLSDLGTDVCSLLERYRRVNINLLDAIYIDEEDQNIYKQQLEIISDRVLSLLATGVLKEVNVITDILFETARSDCSAGNRSITLAPDGMLYVCPAFYYSHLAPIGSVSDSETENVIKKSDKRLPLCGDCDVYHCKVCRYWNFMKTAEIAYPAKAQCTTSMIERSVSKIVYDKALNMGVKLFPHNLCDVVYTDPLDKDSFTIGAIAETRIGKGKQ